MPVVPAGKKSREDAVEEISAVLAACGDLHIVERDPLTAAMLSENLGRHCISGHEFSVHVCNLSDYSFSDQSYLHLDPDRRVEGRVARDPSRFSPT